jgi:DNA-binding transcriptional ArsR family regulator
MSRVKAPLQSGLSRVAEALADPAREAIVSALVDGKARPAGELALIAGISPQSASGHLQKLVDAHLLSVWPQGRFRYYHIADEDVASAIESLANLAARSEPSLKCAKHPIEFRQCRSCYRHLAGQLGVAISQTLMRRQYVSVNKRDGFVTETGLAWCRQEGIGFRPSASPAVRLCFDWTERVPHLAGAFANAVLQRMIECNYLRPGQIHRSLRLTDQGRAFLGRLHLETEF